MLLDLLLLLLLLAATDLVTTATTTIPTANHVRITVAATCILDVFY
jgi:hypothetical protein